MAARQKAEESAAAPIATLASIPDSAKQEKQQSESANDAKENSKEADGAKTKKEENAPKEAAKPQDKSRPVSSTPVPGTPWYTSKFVHFK